MTLSVTEVVQNVNILKVIQSSIFCLITSQMLAESLQYFDASAPLQRREDQYYHVHESVSPSPPTDFEYQSVCLSVCLPVYGSIYLSICILL